MIKEFSSETKKYGILFAWQALKHNFIGDSFCASKGKIISVILVNEYFGVMCAIISNDLDHHHIILRKL